MSAGLEDVQAGDVVCCWPAYGGREWRAEVVTRTTATLVFVGHEAYTRRSGFARKRASYLRTSIFPLTPKRIEEARVDALKRAREEAVAARVSRIVTAKLHDLTTEQLDRILAIIGEGKP